MHERLVVNISERCRLPQAVVPRALMWSLVEFLACQRVRVSYSYFPSHFTVTFLNSSVDAGQQLLDDWLQLEAGSAQGHTRTSGY